MKSRVLRSAPILGAFVLGLLLFHPIAKAVESFAIVTCHAQSPCDGGTNSGKGPGVQGISANGTGVVGQTMLASTSSNFKAGVVGQDKSSKGKFDSGVWGKSARGYGVKGTSNNGFGTAGFSYTTGVFGQVTGTASTPTGVIGLDATQNTNGAGVAGQTNVGTGVIAATLGSKNNTQALLASATNGGNVFVGVGPGNYEIALIDGSGNMQISGEIFTSGQCASGCMRSRGVREYGSKAAAPMLEDVGEAQLSNGAAYVRLDPAFANAIDARQGYFVLITPESDTRGLFVTQRTPAGFAVRESAGGRSSGPFSYRIEAHPYGVREPRLPMTNRPQIQVQHATPETAQF